MNKKVLVTGGAGFIGSHFVDLALADGIDPIVVDPGKPACKMLCKVVPFKIQDMAQLGPEFVESVFEGVDVVVHLAADLGVGVDFNTDISMMNNNVSNTTALFDLISRYAPSVRRVVIASSASCVGEGAYADKSGKLHFDVSRRIEDLRQGKFDVYKEGDKLVPMPVAEDAPIKLSSIYGLSKFAQEQSTLLLGEKMCIEVVALRFSNVFGPRQNPNSHYSGVVSLFKRLAERNEDLTIFEDGWQSRDFVYVRDVASAIKSALNRGITGNVYHIGSGKPTSIRDVADLVLKRAPSSKSKVVSHSKGFRHGDVRHFLFDISKAGRELNYQPKYTFEQGLDHFFKTG